MQPELDRSLTPLAFLAHGLTLLCVRTISAPTPTDPQAIKVELPDTGDFYLLEHIYLAYRVMDTGSFTKVDIQSPVPYKEWAWREHVRIMETT